MGVQGSRRPGTVGRPLLAALLGLVVALSVPAPSESFVSAATEMCVYWTDNGIASTGQQPSRIIWRANLDGSNPVPFVDRTGGVTRRILGLAVDGEHAYWVDETSSAISIGRARLDGTEIEPQFIVLPGASGLAVGGSYLYWASGGATIGRAKVDGTEVDPAFIQLGLDEAGVPPQAYRLAVNDSHLFWLELFNGESKLGDVTFFSQHAGMGRADIDGSNVIQPLVDFHLLYGHEDINSGGVGFNGIALDDGHVYWSGTEYDRAEDQFSAVVGRAGLDVSGADPRTIVFDGDPGGFDEYSTGLAVSSAHLYWGHAHQMAVPQPWGNQLLYQYSLGRAALDGSSANRQFLPVDDAAQDVAIGPCTGTDVPDLSIDWEIEPRFLDLNEDGRITYTLGKIGEGPGLSQDFMVWLKCDPDPGLPTGVAGYRWTFDGTSHDTSTCSMEEPLAVDAEGVYPTTIEALGADGTVLGSATRDVVVQDLLVVSIGDSVGSGEGDPDLRIRPQGDDSFLPAEWQDRRCHRSALAGSSLAARQLEDADERSSLSFIHLACSGGTISNGVLGPYASQEVVGKKIPDLPPQLWEIRGLVPAREIDALLISVGANDLGFGAIVVECANPATDCRNLWDARLNTRLLQLTEAYDRLAACISKDDAACSRALTASQRKAWPSIQSLGLAPERVYISQYFDPTTDEFGNRCESILVGATKDELDWVSDTMLRSLNGVVEAAARRNGWQVVMGAASGFIGHGYCANDQQRWIRTFGESLDYQGGIDGTLHPNEAGHGWYRDALFSAVSVDVMCEDGLPRPPGPDARC
jgi:hypothetical protein